MVKAYFENFKLFEDHEIEKFLPYFERRTLAKNAYFAQEGKPCLEVAFVSKGILRSYYSLPDGNMITFCFRFPQDLMASYSSFITGNPSLESIHALAPTELFVIKKEKIEELAATSTAWLKFLRIIAEQQYMELEMRVFQFQKESAAERYQYLLKNQPNYIQHIPLGYIASYLGISQRHLSRIRKEINF